MTRPATDADRLKAIPLPEDFDPDGKYGRMLNHVPEGWDPSPPTPEEWAAFMAEVREIPRRFAERKRAQAA